MYKKKKKEKENHSGKVDQIKSCLLSIPAEGASAKLHAITFWAQVGTIGTQLLCMETKLQMVFSNRLCLLASTEG